MLSNTLRSFCVFCCLSGMSFSALADYSEHPKALAMVERLVAEHNFSRDDLLSLLAKAEKQQSVLDAISRPAEKTMTWARYQKIFLTDERQQKGVAFWQAHRDTLARAEREYGVAAEVIVAILGVETYYGTRTGSYRVLDALTTLGFDYPPRGDFFTRELEQFLLLSREQQQNPTQLLGSYAGAMGYGQFIPSSYRAYAVDFDGDEIADIWQNPTDAIGSVANYLARHRWQRDGEVAFRLDGEIKDSLVGRGRKLDQTVAALRRQGVKLPESLADDSDAMIFRLQGTAGEETWLGLQNFYSITRYNHSPLYAMAVFQLAEGIKRDYEAAISAAR